MSYQSLANHCLEATSCKPQSQPHSSCVTSVGPETCEFEETLGDEHLAKGNAKMDPTMVTIVYGVISASFR